MVKRELSDKNKNIISSLAILVFAVALFFFLFFSTNLFNSDASSQAQIRKIEKKLTNIEIPEIPEAEFIDNSKENNFQGVPSLPSINEINNYDFIAHPNHPAFSKTYGLLIDDNVLSVSDDIIYNQGYYSISGGAWTIFTLQGTPYGNGQPWLLDDGASILPATIEGAGTHYVIVYSCTFINGAWDCHGDLENGQMVSKWQLEVINVGTPPIEPPSNSVAAFAQCVTDAGAVMYGTDTCSSCKAQKALFGDNWQYINYVNCKDRESECDAAGVDGIPVWIINGRQYGFSSFARLSGATNCPVP